MKRFIPYIMVVALVFIVIGEVFPQSTDGDGYVRGFTRERGRALSGAVVGLFSVIMAWRSRRISTSNPGSGRSLSVMAFTIALIAVVLNSLHLANAGALGTGGGKAGAIVGLALSVAGFAISGLTLLRSKKV